MKKKERQLRKMIIALHKAGTSVEQLAKDSHELGVRPRFIYRVLGYRRRRVRLGSSERTYLAWMPPQ